MAQKLNLRSGHEVDRVVKSIRKIDELKEQGRHMDAELIKMVLNNNSPSAAAELSANIDKISEDDKQAIREKKISANKVIEKITGRAAKRRKTIIEHNNSNELKMLSVEEIVADLKDENKDRSLTQYQIALTIQSNIKQLVYAFETVRDEKLFNESMDRQSKEICVEALNQLKGLIKVLENKINI